MATKNYVDSNGGSVDKIESGTSNLLISGTNLTATINGVSEWETDATRTRFD